MTDSTCEKAKTRALAAATLLCYAALVAALLVLGHSLLGAVHDAAAGRILVMYSLGGV